MSGCDRLSATEDEDPDLIITNSRSGAAAVLRATGRLIGRGGLWQPDGWPGVEVGWILERGNGASIRVAGKIGSALEGEHDRNGSRCLVYGQHNPQHR